MSEAIYRLYATPSLFSGIARLMDVWGTLDRYDYSRSGEEADYRAIESDWENIGLDFYRAIDKFKEEYADVLHG